MKKNDRIKLDVISNIRESIIDEVTDRKIVLSRKLVRTVNKAKKDL